MFKIGIPQTHGSNRGRLQVYKMIRSIILPALLSFVLIPSVGSTQDCPQWGDKAGALKFLEENKAHGTAADPVCVSRSFATLSHDKKSAEVLVWLLDFERSVEQESFKTIGAKYPAIGALAMIGTPAVPYLIKAIKESDVELIRTNAARSLGVIYRPCVKGVLAKLEAEAEKNETTPEQQTRLRTAKEYLAAGPSPCKSEIDAQ